MSVLPADKVGAAPVEVKEGNDTGGRPAIDIGLVRPGRLVRLGREAGGGRSVYMGDGPHRNLINDIKLAMIMVTLARNAI